jgi:hypothetical protein
MSNYLYRLARLAFRRRRLVLAAWLAAAVAAIAVAQAIGGKTNDKSLPGADHDHPPVPHKGPPERRAACRRARPPAAGGTAGPAGAPPAPRSRRSGQVTGPAAVPPGPCGAAELHGRIRADRRKSCSGTPIWPVSSGERQHGRPASSASRAVPRPARAPGSSGRAQRRTTRSINNRRPAMLLPLPCHGRQHRSR